MMLAFLLILLSSGFLAVLCGTNLEEFLGFWIGFFFMFCVTAGVIIAISSALRAIF